MNVVNATSFMMGVIGDMRGDEEGKDKKDKDKDKEIGNGLASRNNSYKPETTGLFSHDAMMSTERHADSRINQAKLIKPSLAMASRSKYDLSFTFVNEKKDGKDITQVKKKSVQEEEEEMSTLTKREQKVKELLNSGAAQASRNLKQILGFSLDSRYA